MISRGAVKKMLPANAPVLDFWRRIVKSGTGNALAIFTVVITAALTLCHAIPYHLKQQSGLGMTDRKSVTNLGRKLLMGVAVGTLPLAGCVPAPAEETAGPVIYVSSAEKALYERALAARNAELATEFVCTHPESKLIRPLLSAMEPSELRRITAECVGKIDADVKDSLSARVKRSIGLLSPITVGQSDGQSDGYSG